MRYIVKMLLIDKTKLYCVVNARNKTEAEMKCLYVEKDLYKNRVLEGKKFKINRSRVIDVEKWDAKGRMASKGALRKYMLVIVGENGGYSCGEVSSPSVKSAYNRTVYRIGEGEGLMLYLYEEGQKPDLATYSTVKARKVLKNKEKTVEALNQARLKANRLAQNNPNLEWLEDITYLGNMVFDYCSGVYREIPVNTIIVAAGAIIYFLGPVDLIPDFIPVAGQMDDAFVIYKALEYSRNDLLRYKAWKDGQDSVA